MLSTLQIAAVSAVLSGVVVGVWEADAQTPSFASSKTFVERVPESSIEVGAATNLTTPEQHRPTQSVGRKADRIVPAGANACGEAGWPYVPHECIYLANGVEPRPIRMITVETRPGENTSILMRMPQTTVAAR